MRKVELFTAQIQEKTLPGWLRGKGFRLLVGEYLPHWEGPEPAGETVVFAFTLHPIGGTDEHAHTIWFLLPEGTPQPFAPERLHAAAEYVCERLWRKGHQPTTGLLNVVLIQDQPTGNN